MRLTHNTCTPDMNVLSLPWLELTLLTPLAGAICAWWCRDGYASARCALVTTAAALMCSVLAWIGFQTGANPGGAASWELLPSLAGRRCFSLDELNAPLLVLVALIHFLTVLATARTKLVRMSFPWLLVAESLRLGCFAVIDYPWLLILIYAAATMPAYFELRRRGKPHRVYVLHMSLFVVLISLGWALLETGLALHLPAWVPCIPLLIAVLVRSGTVPGHLWVADLFENGPFSTAILYATPIAGMYAAVRLVFPVCPDWVLSSIGIVSLITAAYSAGMAIVQTDARRFFAYVFLSHASMILLGLELHTTISLTGALALWISVTLSLTGLGLTLRALEARFGRLKLDSFHGLYEHTPTLAVCFLLTGLASVGYPGTLGFVAAELLVDGAIEVNLALGFVVVLAGALNGIAILRAYFLIFTGGRHFSAVSLVITPRERFAVLTLTAIILGGGLAPQVWVDSRLRAAEALLEQRSRNAGGHASPTAASAE